MTSQELISDYFNKNYRVVFWPGVADQKGPKIEGWTTKPYTLSDFRDGMRVGLITGVEISPGKFYHDLDIDWAKGAPVALAFLPPTNFVYGRHSKPISHCGYTLPEAIPSIVFRCPVTKTTLLEFRGTKENGELGWQNMAPPSVWQNKEGKQEPLEFKRYGDPAHIADLTYMKQRVTYSAIGMLLAMHFGTNGFGHEARLAWAGCLLRVGISVDDLVTMGNAISPLCHNTEQSDVRRSVESTAAALQKEGKKVKGGPALMRILGMHGHKIVSTIYQWLGLNDDFIKTEKGVIIADHQENIRRALHLLGVELSYNLFAERLLVKYIDTGQTVTVDDRAINSLWLRCDREFRFRPSFVFFEKVLQDVAHEGAFHPVRDYLSGLVWDGVARIDALALATYGGADDHTSDSDERGSYLAAVSSIVLIAAVRRVRSPGCKYDEMLVLESEQGLSKSSALRALSPSDDWFSDDLPLNVDAKEVIERTLGKWIIEASDLVGGRKADRDHLKSLMSRQVDGPARLAYAHLPCERPRQFVIIGTTNSAEYLADMTGARRFWPVRVKRFDVDGIVRDRDQLWAEAATREAKGESIRLSEELWGKAGEHQEERREVDAWEDALTDAIRNIDVSASGRRQVTADVLWGIVGVSLERRDRAGAKRISEIMQRLGFVRKTVRDEQNRPTTGYVGKVTGGSLLESELP
jgi:predicted P-loop ATPase